MLYLIQPDRAMRWCQMPSADQILDVAREGNADLARLEWTPLERRADDDVLRLVLRHGVPCTAGMVVSGARVYVLDRPDALRATHQAAQDSDAAVRRQSDAWMERLLPGWTEGRDAVDAGVEQSFETALGRAERQAARQLAGDPDPELVEHWRSLSGPVPTG